jgi:hypothetical protein
MVEEMRELPGCAGGGGKGLNLDPAKRVIQSLNPRIAKSDKVLEKEECSCGENTDNHYHCPDCDHKFSDETAKTAEQRTKKCGCGFEFGC